MTIDIVTSLVKSISNSHILKLNPKYHSIFLTIFYAKMYFDVFYFNAEWIIFLIVKKSISHNFYG